MSLEIAWKQNILVTAFHLLKSLPVVFGFGSQAFVCGFSRQNINSAGGTDYAHLITTDTPGFSDLPTALTWCIIYKEVFKSPCTAYKKI